MSAAKPENLYRQIVELTHDHLTGAAAPADLALLENLLESHPAAPQIYIDCINEAIFLRDWASRGIREEAVSGQQSAVSQRGADRGERIADSQSRGHAPCDSGPRDSGPRESSRHTPCAVTESEKTPVVRGPLSVVSSQFPVVSGPLSVANESASESSPRTTDHGPRTTPFIPQSAFRIPHSFSRQPLVYSCFVATVATAVILMIASQIPVGSLGGLAGRGGSSPAANGFPSGEPVQYVARFTDGSDYVWDGPEWEAPWRGGPLHEGQEVRLKSGLAELTFASGAKIILEGPTSIRLASKNGMDLEQGKLSARVPQSAIGFTVDTPSGKVVDLGTEFGVEVTESGDMTVQVFKGEVLVDSAGSKNPSPSDPKIAAPQTADGPIKLSANEAIRVSAADRRIARVENPGIRFPEMPTVGENVAPIVSVDLSQAGPTDLANLHAWWRADSIQGHSNGQPIKNWPDSSGNSLGLDLTPTPGSLNGGTYSERGFNGRPAISLVTDATIGTSSSLRTKNNFGLTGNPAYTIFLAIQYLGADGGQGHPFFWGCEGPPGSHQGFEFEPSGWLDIAGGHGHDYTTMAKGPWEDFNLISARHTTPGPTHATTMVAVNGKGVDATGASITLNIDDSPAYVGFWPFSGGVRGINGMIAEIIVYNRALTDGEENAIGYYLTRKYGIATAYVASP